MKKSILFMFISIFAVGISLGLTSCGKHNHSVSNWETVTEASCTAEGLKKGVCDECGEEITETIAKKPHEFEDWVEEYAPTCLAEGLKSHSCKNCGTEETESIAKISHVPVTIQGQAPTCTEAGYTEEILCSECQTVLKQKQTLAATGHSFDSWQILEAPDCEVPGLKKRSCTNCSVSETERIDELHHNWGTASASEDNPGHHKRVCQNNPEHILEQQCSYSFNKKVEATCTAGGYVSEVCLECQDERKIDQTDMLGHNYTGVNNGWVSVTIDETSEGHEHKHYRQCFRCNEHTDEATCNLQHIQSHEPTCVLAGYDEWRCSECGVVHEAVDAEKPATGHNYEYKYYPVNVIQGKHYQECLTCHKTTASEDCRLSITKHPATCEEDSHTDYDCAICGQHITLAGKARLGHDFIYTFNGSKEEPTHLVKCGRPGCDYVENTQDCQLEKTSEKLPTCTADGVVTNVCKYCLESITESGLSAVGHSWEWTTLTDSEHTRYCAKCKTAETKSHQLTLKTYVPASCTEYEVSTYECSECNKEIIKRGSEEFGHVWQVDNIFGDRHEIHCLKCSASETGAHDWTECNLCSGCGLDALTYKTEGNHCTVTNTGKLRCPTIIIPEYHRELDGNGNYQANQFQVTAIADSAFRFVSGDNRYTKSVTIPASVESIGYSAFLYCRALKEFKIDGENPSLKYIGDLAFGICPLLETFDAPESLISIGERAFVDCTKLTNISVKENDNLEFIGAWAFHNTGFVNDEANWSYQVDQETRTDALYIGKHLIYARQVGDNTEFDILDGTLTISASAFDNFVNLTKVVLRPSITVIDRDAFKKCVNLKSVEFTGTVDDWFDIRFVNEYSSPLYHGDTGLHIDSAKGVIDLSDKTFTHLPAGTFEGDDDITKVILPESLTEIGMEAFKGCTALTEIEFRGQKVQRVGRDAFTGSGVYNFVDGAVYVGYILVKVDASQETFVVKDGTLSIAVEAFKSCDKLTSVTIDADTKFVGENAFGGCTAMQTIIFENNIHTWTIFIEGSIGRGFKGDELVWERLKGYNGIWYRP